MLLLLQKPTTFTFLYCIIPFKITRCLTSSSLPSMLLSIPSHLQTHSAPPTTCSLTHLSLHTVHHVGCSAAVGSSQQADSNNLCSRSTRRPVNTLPPLPPLTLHFHPPLTPLPPLPTRHPLTRHRPLVDCRHQPALSPLSSLRPDSHYATPPSSSSLPSSSVNCSSHLTSHTLSGHPSSSTSATCSPTSHSSHTPHSLPPPHCTCHLTHPPTTSSYSPHYSRASAAVCRTSAVSTR